jgi:hypothetical protein
MSRSRDVIVMPAELTPAMRKAAEAVKPPITIAEEPYLDKLWRTLVEVAREEQGIRDTERTRDYAQHAHDVATAGLQQRG